MTSQASLEELAELLADRKRKMEAVRYQAEKLLRRASILEDEIHALEETAKLMNDGVSIWEEEP